MSLAGEFLYFLMVTLLYGSPVILGVLWYCARRRRLGAGLAGVALVAPLAALLLQLAMRGGVLAAGAARDRDAAAIAAYLGDPGRADVVPGAFVGTESRGGLEYRRYQFASLDGRSGRALEISLPPDGAGAIAYIELSGEVAPSLAEARMLVWPARIELNPAVATDEFFRNHYPGQAPQAYGLHTLIVGLRVGRSVIVHPPQARGSWRWTEADLDLVAP